MIVHVPDPVLTLPSKTIGQIDKKILDVVSQMKRTLIEKDNPKGVGLAAVQIGIPLKIFIAKPEENSEMDVFINPEIIEYSKNLAEIERPASAAPPAKPLATHGKASASKEKKLEGCLSIPNVWGYLKRPKTVKLKYLDINGQTQTKVFSGFMATIVQHETDHLNGILFTQRVLEQKQKLYRIEGNEKGEEKLIELEI